MDLEFLDFFFAATPRTTAIEELLGYIAEPELIHRDNLVLI